MPKFGYKSLVASAVISSLLTAGGFLLYNSVNKSDIEKSRLEESVKSRLVVEENRSIPEKDISNAIAYLVAHQKPESFINMERVISGTPPSLDRNNDFFVSYGARDPEGIVEQRLFINGSLYTSERAPNKNGILPVSVRSNSRQVAKNTNLLYMGLNTLTLEITDITGEITRCETSFYFVDVPLNPNKGITF